MMDKTWELVSLNEVLELDVDAEEIDPTKDYPFAGLSGFGKGLFYREVRNGMNTSYKAFNKLHQNRLVFSKVKGWEGAIGIVTEEFENMYLSPMYPTLKLQRPEDSLSFVLYYCKQEKVWEELLKKSKGLGARRNSVSEDQFLSLQIPFPKPEIQHKVAGKIHKFETDSMRLIELKQKQLEDLEILLYSTYVDLTRGCPTEKMSIVAPITRRPVEVEMEREYKELAARSFGKGTFVKPTFKGVDLTWQKPYWVKGGDLLFSNIKAWEGSIALVSEEEKDWVVSHRYITCVPNEEMVSPHFLLYYLLSPKGMEQVNLASPGSADRNRTLSLRKLDNIDVPIPPLDKQKEFEELLEKTRQMKAHIAASQQELDELFPALLDKAFKGELV